MPLTHEQRTADESLRAAAPGYRVTSDREGWPVISGRLGQIEYHDGHHLAVYTDRPRMIRKLLAIRPIQRHQTGDQEARMLFPASGLSAVSEAIRARRKRSVSAASLANLRPSAGASTRFGAPAAAPTVRPPAASNGLARVRP